MQRLCVCVGGVGRGSVCGVPACLRRSICISLPRYAVYVCVCVREHMCMCANEKYKLKWTALAKKSSCVSARMKFPPQVGEGSGLPDS